MERDWPSCDLLTAVPLKFFGIKPGVLDSKEKVASEAARRVEEGTPRGFIHYTPAAAPRKSLSGSQTAL